MNENIRLSWHQYKYFPYEKELALREIRSLLKPTDTWINENGVDVSQSIRPSLVSRLVYFATASGQGASLIPTQQSLLERVNGNGVNRQSTRYSAHGLHEYKGKFNPQVAKAMLNIFEARAGQRVLDPFCGSGTALVECAHLGINSVGTDINPLAVYLANAKLTSLGVPADDLRSYASLSLARAKRSRAVQKPQGERGEYLCAWFIPEYLSEIERLRLAIEADGGPVAPVLLALASNLLRDYSLQEPRDLRIRRRKSPFPETSFYDAYEAAVCTYCTRLADAQRTIGIKKPDAKAIHVDCRKAPNHPDIRPGWFDLALTSPPYATALPYVDTQRLSLIWLELISPSELPVLESELVGSREIRGQRKGDLLAALEANNAGLPKREAALCLRLQNALDEGDGFRRQATPRLLYRYFADMAGALTSVRQLVKPNAPFGLIVGSNKTVLGGKQFDINTPKHLTSIAIERGWRHIETIPLQTYQRYGLHMGNSTSTEALVILKASS